MHSCVISSLCGRFQSLISNTMRLELRLNIQMELEDYKHNIVFLEVYSEVLSETRTTLLKTTGMSGSRADHRHGHWR